jgi:Protein of unknown function (DUF429)
MRDTFAASETPVIALIDSPRWPSDCDSRVSSLLRQSHAGGRLIDKRLRAIVRSLTAASPADSTLRLSLFPTPRRDYFLRCISDPTCKPHLRALGRQLFDSGGAIASNDGPRGGAIFTRFMLAGFAAYRALEALSVLTFEAYPDLQFRLWRDDLPLAPKGAGGLALAHRSKILANILKALTATLKLDTTDQIPRQIVTMDKADAAILALSACAASDQGTIALIDEPEEGCFAIPLRSRQADSLGLTCTATHVNLLTSDETPVSFVCSSDSRG